jgi:hypothetical protein
MFLYSLYRRAQREEAALAAIFGEEWCTYAARVPMFTPSWSGRGMNPLSQVIDAFHPLINELIKSSLL